MIFAEFQYPCRYADVHDELLALVRKRFAEVQSGLQGDSWIWIMDGGEKVVIDTFSFMHCKMYAGNMPLIPLGHLYS
ncbi:MAG: hypothetical protein RQ826_07050 [Xanthomonadales bacterium]|nr:hypothetical protein [Xanthomonadales bacterium]